MERMGKFTRKRRVGARRASMRSLMLLFWRYHSSGYFLLFPFRWPTCSLFPLALLLLKAATISLISRPPPFHPSSQLHQYTTHPRSLYSRYLPSASARLHQYTAPFLLP